MSLYWVLQSAATPRKPSQSLSPQDKWSFCAKGRSLKTGQTHEQLTDVPRMELGMSRFLWVAVLIKHVEWQELSIEPSIQQEEAKNLRDLYSSYMGKGSTW